ncbi:MAG: hypothetical protein K0U93_27600 [Gammaproteobacteria bacterium]|nr:hypothetical protein [Gammaproteobacteria bacterium]
MTALTIQDLPINTELDKAAMEVIRGGGRVAYRFLGSSVGAMSSWQYTGQRSSRFTGYSYLRGKGWTRRYRTAYQYKRQQFKVNHFNEYWR